MPLGMAWQDFHGMNLADATAALKDLQAAKISGQPTMVMIAGVRTEIDPKSVNLSETIRELQKYIFELDAENIDPETPIDPYTQRPGITRARFC
jgi:hypothetical protein